MVLAYVFWHRPRPDADQDAYEEAQRLFHRELEGETACFRVASLPFEARSGYEDWYLVEDWAALGELNGRAVDRRRRESHDEAAALAAEGWGAIYGLLRGEPLIPRAVEWREKPRGRPAAEHATSSRAEVVWRRQLVLGPAPELCLGSRGPAPGRESIWP